MATDAEYVCSLARRVHWILPPGRILCGALAEGVDQALSALSAELRQRGWILDDVEGTELGRLLQHRGKPKSSDSYPARDLRGAVLLVRGDEQPARMRSLFGVLQREVASAVVLVGLGGADDSLSENRSAWVDAALQHGFRRHPCYQFLTPYSDLERERAPFAIALEPISTGPLARYPLERLRESRGLHMDMLRETGRRADAHVARYMTAAALVRPYDVVVDCACGLGYGSQLIAAATPAARVIGIDSSPYAIDYASAMFVTDGLEYREGDACDLPFADGSVDLAITMETVEHLERPGHFLSEIARVLRPGGRVILSVPNLWVDETGNDPNPHHLHVFDAVRVAELTRQFFFLETIQAQNAGGGMRSPNAARTMKVLSAEGITPADEEEAEWWIVTGLKHPAARGLSGAADLPSFEDARRMPASGEADLLPPEVAERVAELAKVGSPEHGAAICSLAYHRHSRGTAAKLREILEKIRLHIDASGEAPIDVHWRVMLSFVAALIAQRLGDRGLAHHWFESTAREDVMRVSPLLAAKTVDACCLNGLAYFHESDESAAIEWWSEALRQTRRAFSEGFATLWGGNDAPTLAGTSEAAEILELSRRADAALGALRMGPHKRALVLQSFEAPRVGHVAASSRPSDDSQHAERAERLAKRIDELDRLLREQIRWTEELQEGKDWLEKQYLYWKPEKERLEVIAAEQRDRIRALEDELARAAERSLRRPRSPEPL